MGLACLSSYHVYVVYMILVKVIQMNLLDEIRALYFRQNGKGKFNVTNFIVFHLFWQTLLAGHFFLFNFIYYVQTDPCLGTFLSLFQVSLTTFNMVLQPPYSVINQFSCQYTQLFISLN